MGEDKTYAMTAREDPWLSVIEYWALAIVHAVKTVRREIVQVYKPMSRAVTGPVKMTSPSTWSCA